MLFKKKEVVLPHPEQEVLIQAIQSWRVEWVSRSGSFIFDTKKEVEFFFSREDANLFANSLRDSFKLLRYTWGTSVVVDENK